MISYVFFGVFTSVVDFSVFSILTSLNCDELISNIISTICAILFAYVTNKIWVFKSKTHGFHEILKEFIRFTNARIATLLMTEVILLISKLINGNPYIAKAVAMILTVILNYIFSKLFIFNKRKGTQNENKETA
jgi:putative flippase GtrA